MAENKKSFVAYSDWNGMFKALPDEVAGKLIKHIFSYVNDENPSSEDFIINALFEQIKATLKRDLVKWDSQREQRSLAGKKSAELRSTKSNERSTVVNENVRKATVSVSDSVNVKKENTYRAFAHLCLSISEFEKLEKEYDKKTIDMVLDSIENFKDNKKYKSLYLTSKNWLSKEKKKHSVIQSDGWEQDFQLGDVMPNGATLTADVINHHQQTGLSYKKLAGL
jgi:hypothetical protein